MTIGVRLLAAGGDEEFHHHVGPGNDQSILVVYTPAQAHGHFKAATLTSANTAIIVQPRAGEAIWITDIIISGEKQTMSDITVQMTDGVDTVIMVIVDQVDAAPNLAMNLSAYFKGWKDARVEMITSGAGDGTEPSAISTAR